MTKINILPLGFNQSDIRQLSQSPLLRKDYQIGSETAPLSFDEFINQLDRGSVDLVVCSLNLNSIQQADLVDFIGDVKIILIVDEIVPERDLDLVDKGVHAILTSSDETPLAYLVKSVLENKYVFDDSLSSLLIEREHQNNDQGESVGVEP